MNIQSHKPRPGIRRPRTLAVLFLFIIAAIGAGIKSAPIAQADASVYPLVRQPHFAS
jgi:hypothetical protein